MVGSTFFAGVALLILIAPFELTLPLLRLPRQSVSKLEAAVVCAFICGAAAVVGSRGIFAWWTPRTTPWIAPPLAIAVASPLSPVSPTTAFSLLQRGLGRLARLTAPAPLTPLIPLLTPQAAAVPTDQSSFK